MWPLNVQSFISVMTEVSGYILKKEQQGAKNDLKKMLFFKICFLDGLKVKISKHILNKKIKFGSHSTRLVSCFST